MSKENIERVKIGEWYFCKDYDQYGNKERICCYKTKSESTYDYVNYSEKITTHGRIMKQKGRVIHNSNKVLINNSIQDTDFLNWYNNLSEEYKCMLPFFN